MRSSVTGPAVIFCGRDPAIGQRLAAHKSFLLSTEVTEAHLIREHMAEMDGGSPLDGDMEADETYVGGRRRGAGHGNKKNKVVVFGMVDAMAMFWSMW